MEKKYLIPMVEIWKPIKGYEGLYEISNLERIKSNARNVLMKNGIKKIIKPRIMKSYVSKYKRIGLNKKGKQSLHLVHRLVAEHFIPNPDNKPCVNHINGIKTDNRIVNLEWCTYSENMVHAVENELTTSLKGRKQKIEVVEARAKKLKGKATWNKGIRQHPPKHGTLYEYNQYKCRCEDCKKCNSDYNKIRKQRRLV